MTPLTPAAVTALAQQAAEPPYDPSCVECRRAAGKDLAGTTWQCVGHVYRERNSLSAEVRRLQQQVENIAAVNDAVGRERDTAFGVRDAALDREAQAKFAIDEIGQRYLDERAAHNSTILTAIAERDAALAERDNAEARATANRAEAAGARADRDVAIARAERAERLLDLERKRRELAHEEWGFALKRAEQAEEAVTMANTTQRNLHDVLRETQAERNRLRDCYQQECRNVQIDLLPALAEARRVLRLAEWDTNGLCPTCRMALPDGHTQHCALAAVLAQEEK